jgi:molybdenum cofactor cytidylyltransferase
MIAALVPASGRSSRMGRPKLLLPIGESTVIARVVSELRRGGADTVLVVAPAPEIEGSAEVAAEARGQGAHVLIPPKPTADMRASIERGLDWLESRPPHEAIVLTPADTPGLRGEVVARLIAAASANPTAIIVPVFRGRRGHPIVLPWAKAAEIRHLPLGSGLNALLALNRDDNVEIELAESGVVEDLDTPQDYRRYLD